MLIYKSKASHDDEQTNRTHITAEQVIEEIESIDNGERIRCQRMLFDKYFDNRPAGGVSERELDDDC